MGVKLDISPAWGIIERASATAVHIGFALLIAWAPWFVVVAMPVHSAMNFGVLRVAKASVGLSQLGFALLGTTLLAIGIAVSDI